jgi:hypothetical protein
LWLRVVVVAEVVQVVQVGVEVVEEVDLEPELDFQ